MRRMLIIAAVLMAAGAARAQPVERLVDAGKVFPMLEKFLAIAPADRSKLALIYLIAKDDKSAGDLHLTLVADGRRTPLPIGPGGRVERVPTSADFAAHAQVAIDTPKEVKIGTRLNVGTTIKPAEEVSAADCALALTQVNSAIHRVAGVMAMMAPRITKVAFPGAESGVAIGADGKQQPLPLVKGKPAYDPDVTKGAKLLRFAKTPTSVELD